MTNFVKVKLRAGQFPSGSFDRRRKRVYKLERDYYDCVEDLRFCFIYVVSRNQLLYR